MYENWDLIIASIFGSILTIVFSKSFELVKDKLLFRRDLKKIYFNRKIESFERVSVQYSKLISTLSELESFFKYYYRNGGKLQIELFNNILNNLKNILITASKESKELSSSLIIFIDIDDKWFKEIIDLNSIIELSDRINDIQNQMNIYYDQIDLSGNDLYNDTINQKLESFQIKLEELSNDTSIQINRSIIAILSIQRKIREQLIKYEN